MRYLHSVPARPRGIISLTLDFISGESASVMAVSMYPGATAFTVMLREATSRAIAMVKPINPAFEARIVRLALPGRSVRIRW